MAEEKPAEHYEKNFFHVLLEDSVRVLTIMSAFIALIVFIFGSKLYSYVEDIIDDNKLAPQAQVLILEGKIDHIQQHEAGVDKSLERLNTQMDKIEELAREQRAMQNQILLELRK